MGKLISLVNTSRIQDHQESLYETIILKCLSTYKLKLYLIRKIWNIFMWMLLKIPLEQLLVKLHPPKARKLFHKNPGKPTSISDKSDVCLNLRLINFDGKI